MANALDKLKSMDFLLTVSPITTASGFRRCLQKSPFVTELRQSLVRGEITEKYIRRFVSESMKDFQRNIQFPHEPALAAVAVALESRKTPFVEEFLNDLARLEINEMDVAPRVAGACLAAWSTLPSSEHRTALFDSRRDYSQSVAGDWLRALNPISPSAQRIRRRQNRFSCAEFEDAAS